LSFVRELEAKSAVERKRLMQSLFDYLGKGGIKAELKQEPAINSLGMSVMESVIQLQGQNPNKISLMSLDSGGCGTAGNIFRFEYEIRMDKELTVEQMGDIRATTEIIKEGKVMNMFGGKPVGIKWTGKKLAETLNNDRSIKDDLTNCAKSWNHTEFLIEAVNPREVYIVGPPFANTEMVIELYKSEGKEQVHCCIFGYTIVDRIAKHIKTNNF
jgi:hypothetical protein